MKRKDVLVWEAIKFHVREMLRTTKVGKRYNQETLRQESDITICHNFGGKKG